MTENMTFRTGKLVYLRTFRKSDSETLQRWMNNQEVTRFLMRAFPITAREEDEWIESQGKDQKNLVLGIVTVDGNRLIGSIGLHQIDLINRNAVTGTVIGEKDVWGKGYGTEAKMLLLDFAFNTLDLLVILSKVLAFNGRSLAYGKKCGYEEVGRIPNWIRKNGERHDEILLVVTQERWRPLWDEYSKNNKSE
jgi:RimJ/RimL family protein N-acetyltransferase